MILKFVGMSVFVGTFSLFSLAISQDSTSCFPRCRTGYICVNGKCIPRCNPPCPEGQICTDSGECIQPPIQKSTASVPMQEDQLNSGWLKIIVPSSEVSVFVDNESVGRGTRQIKVSTGVHRVTAKTGTQSKSELVEVFEDELTSVTPEIDLDSRRIRFFAGFDASWMLGRNAEFGPSHIAGMEIDKKHLIAVNFYWGVPVFNSTMFGGGFNYLWTINLHEVFLARIGGVAGFWKERLFYEDVYPYYETMDGWDYYYGGPKFRLEVGYKYVYFTIVDATLLQGTSTKGIVNSGMSFRF